jgi:metallophosphoesterase (TIGR00282 family)
MQATFRSTGTQPVDRNVLRLLAVGDVYAGVGRRALKHLLPQLRHDFDLDLVVVNGENSAGGRGISMRTARELRDAGADLITTGNHVWAQPDANQVLDDPDLRVVRPANYPDPAPGRGMVQISIKGRTISLINVLGRVFMEPLDDPFRAIDTTLLTLERKPVDGEHPIVLVEMHAEATSEKQAMGWYLDGRVSAVWGTHTHVPTADGRVLPGGTGYVTDLGMTGAYDSIIGASVTETLQRFLTQRSLRLKAPDDGIAMLNAVLFEIDLTTGACLSVQRVDRYDANGEDDDAGSHGGTL